MSKNKACSNIAKEILKKRKRVNIHLKKVDRKLLQRDEKPTGKAFLNFSANM